MGGWEGGGEVFNCLKTFLVPPANSSASAHLKLGLEKVWVKVL